MAHKNGISRSRYDAVIVGARCAGAAAAMLMARAGARVLVVDRQPYGSETLSTHALMRPAVQQLARWGLLERLIESGASVIRTTTFHYGGNPVTVPIRPEPGLPGLIAPRRALLDRSLVDAARQAGAEIVHGVSVRALSLDARGRAGGVAVRDVGEEGAVRLVRAGLVIGADGLGSTVAREAGAQIIRKGAASAAVLYRYASIDAGGGYHWHFGEGESAGVIPTDSGLSCIFVSAPTRRFDAELRRSPEAGFRSILERVAPRVAAAARFVPQEPLRMFRGAPGLMRQPYGPGWVLAGDAGFFRDPITSHGISDALRDAEGAALAALAGTETAMRAFQEERDSCAHAIFDATEAICRFDWTVEELQRRHRQFSEAMKAECAVIDSRGRLDRHLIRPAV